MAAQLGVSFSLIFKSVFERIVILRVDGSYDPRSTLAITGQMKILPCIRNDKIRESE